jgi:hypothetical protein
MSIYVRVVLLKLKKDGQSRIFAVLELLGRQIAGVEVAVKNCINCRHQLFSSIVIFYNAITNNILLLLLLLLYLLLLTMMPLLLFQLIIIIKKNLK